MSALLVLVSATAAQPLHAAEHDAAFIQSITGQWVGPGEIVAGKYKGTKFVCTFDGLPSDKSGMTLDGGCRIGVFTQKLSATIEQGGKHGYTGRFLDGAKGKGLDVTSGDVVDSRKMVLALHRKELRGSMIARLSGEDSLNVTVSVKVEKQMVPVIGISLKRVDATPVGSLAKQ